MKNYKTKLVEKQVVHEIVCNRCGKTHEVQEGDYIEQAKFHHVHIPLSYGSKFDNEYNISLDYDICDDCLEKELNEFTYNPFTLNNMAHTTCIAEVEMNS